MKKGTSRRLTRENLAELESLAELPDDAIDTSDVPELRDWSGAKRGLFYRPVKQQLTLRLDADVVDWFKKHTASDEGYQTRINRALREYVGLEEKRGGRPKKPDPAPGFHETSVRRQAGKSRFHSDEIAAANKRIAELSNVVTGSEDELIYKVVLPFFEIIGYGPDSFALKFPVPGYRPNRPGRKPEADCVFFAGPEHDQTSSLVVVEIKREGLEFPEQQARFYSTNLFAPFYIAWKGSAFEIWQVQNYRAPALLDRYRLDQIDRATLAKIRDLLHPDRVVQFCEKNQIKTFDFDDRRKVIEACYLDRLITSLRTFKALDSSKIRDLDSHYVHLQLKEFATTPLRAAQEKILQGTHPEIIEMSSNENRTFDLSDLMDRLPAIAIIGDPGAGKTTLLKHVCLNNAYADSRQLPIFISVRELVATGLTLSEYALRQVSRYGNTQTPEYLFYGAFDQGRMLLCIDGIDELDIHEPRDARAAIIRFNAELSDVLDRHPGNRLLVTARRESWSACRPLLSQTLREFVVVPFTLSAVRAFVSQWFSEAPRDAERIIDALRARGWPPFATNPLLLTLVCACITIEGELPERASDLYARFSSFILEQWNSTRRISDRPPVTNLNLETMSELLGEVALAFHSQRRAVFKHTEVISQLANHLSLLGSPTPTPRDVFIEVTKQHGLLRSWSIEQHYAFPHLSFQAYFVAKAARSRSDGHRIMVEHKRDPFWREAIVLYAELGDITDLACELLAAEDDLLASNLLLLAECWAAGGEINDPRLSNAALKHLLTLARGENAFLADQATKLLARISIPEVKTVLAAMIRGSDGHFTKDAASRFAALIFGESILDDIISQLVRTGYDDNLLENFASLPRTNAIQRLHALIVRTDWPNEKELGHDPCIRHLRRDAERLMAKIGEDIALSPLMQLMCAPELSDFEKAGCISAIASVDHPTVPAILHEILGGNFSTDCRIEAARNLAPHEPDARRFLLRVTADEAQDYFDRRDAAHVLSEFTNLTNDDLPAFRSLIFDPVPEFIGGPMVAVSTVGKIGTGASRALLREALAFWEDADHPEAPRVRDAILQALNLADKSTDLRTILEKAGTDRYINIDLPQVALEYWRRAPERASNLFIRGLRSYGNEVVYMGTLAWAVLRIVPAIPLTDDLLEAAIDLAKRMPKDILSWSTVASAWHRRDLSITQRALFQSAPHPANTYLEKGYGA